MKTKNPQKGKQKNRRNMHPMINRKGAIEKLVTQLEIQQILRDAEIVARWYKNPFYIK